MTSARATLTGTDDHGDDDHFATPWSGRLWSVWLPTACRVEDPAPAHLNPALSNGGNETPFLIVPIRFGPQLVNPSDVPAYPPTSAAHQAGDTCLCPYGLWMVTSLLAWRPWVLRRRASGFHILAGTSLAAGFHKSQNCDYTGATLSVLSHQADRIAIRRSAPVPWQEALRNRMRVSFSQ